ncbi:adenosylcobinamide-GDP ribazoletransferase [Hoeflea sp.]|uniref:adenosylcobinamide-GDP ribazoletransferase n=1 Tax=Hoeflea sp. TaxID=1940281 RepID=UPI0019A1C1D4|nr:adenosylcobinamide-GDP ribazoletransferase [Hoeflea sp.]MBC7282362.1 adenosylcobinamide-GDP ribazoletransferase [Hoeflea sp.]
MQFSNYLDDIARATGFLSRLPVPARYFEGYDGSLSRASGMFPAAGVVIALVPALVVLILSWLGANPALTAMIAITASIALTGGLHEDGLADSADAFGARGGRDQMLEIMKDSRTGTYGALALVLSFAFRATSLTILLSVHGAWSTFLLLLAVAAASRAAITWHWNALPPARQDGVAASVGAPEDSAATRSLATGGILFVALAVPSAGFMPALLALGVLTAFVSLWTSIVREKLHGHTGDTLGASQQIAETTCLVALALLV